MRSTSGVAQAAVQLLGSILQLDTAANTANLAMEILNLPRFDEQRIQKNIQGQVTQVVRSLNSAKRADIEAAQAAVEETLKNFQPSEAALRVSLDPGRLRNHILTAFPTPFRMISKDPAAVHCFNEIFSVAIDRLCQELRNSGRAVMPLLIEAHDQIGGLDQRTLNLQSSYSNILKKVDDLGQYDFYDKNRVSGMVDALGRLKGLDSRSSCRLYIEPPEAFSHISTTLENYGIATVWGPPMSGRFELLRQWCERNGRTEVVVVDCRLEGGLSAGVDALALRMRIKPERTTALTLAKMCDESAGITVLLDGVESDGDLRPLEEHLNPGASAVLATLDFQPRSMIRSAYQLRPLTADDIEQILRSELAAERFTGSLDGIDAVAHILVGQPLLAKQAASYIADCCHSVGDYRSGLESDLRVSFVANTRVEQRTAHSVWSHSISRVEGILRRQGVCALATLRLLSGKAVTGVWELAICFLQSGNDEPGLVEQARSSAKQLCRLGLVDDKHGYFISSSPFLSFAWEQLDESEKTKSVEATLREIRYAAGSARVSRDAGAVNGAVVAVSEPYFRLREYNPAMFDAATLQAAICLGEMGLEEFAIWVLEMLIRLQVKDADADAQTTLLSIASIALSGQLVGSIDYALEVTDELLSAKDARIQLEAFLLRARALWEAGDLAAGLSTISSAVNAFEASEVEGDDRILLGLQIYRLRGWFRISLGGNLAIGLNDLCRAVEFPESDDRFWYAARLARADAIKFLTYRRIVPPKRLTETSNSLGGLTEASKLPEGLKPEQSLNLSLSVAMADTQRLTGNFDAAEQLLGGPPQVGFGELDIACNTADNLQRKLQLIIDRIEANPYNKNYYSMLQEGLALAKQGLEVLARLPEDLVENSRARRIAAGLKTNLSAILVGLHDNKTAIDVAREALEIDVVEFGVNHKEYAHDAVALGVALLTNRRLGEAKNWFKVAHDIFSQPGPQMDLVSASKVKILLATAAKSN